MCKAQLRSNQLVNHGAQGNGGLGTVEVSGEGRQVHLSGWVWGCIWVIRTVSNDRDVEHWATNDLSMRVQPQDSLPRQASGIEVYLRDMKQCCGVENSQARKAEAQRQHTRMALQLSCDWKRAV